jgi:hypothetical protein
MSGEGLPRHAPRHLAPTGRRRRHLHAPGQIGAAAHLKPMAARALEAEEVAEVPPLARVQRGRAAIALSVTLAALPVLVLDNLPARASTNEGLEAVVTAVVEESTSTQETLPTTVTTEAPTSTTVAPTTSEPAPPTTEAPPITAAPIQTYRAAPPTTAPPATTTTRPPAPQNGDPNDPATWDKLAQCESGGNWSMNSGNGYYGGLQFSLATWREVGGAGYPHQNTKAEQVKRGKILQARYGWGQWPHCARELGYL